VSNRVIEERVSRIKAFDTAIDFTLKAEVNDAALDLTGATVLFLMKSTAAGTTVFSATATVDAADAENGIATYTPNGAFPTAAGVYEQEWEVTQSDGTVLTFPLTSKNKVTIIEDLNAA
jgi:hypothetical protein